MLFSFEVFLFYFLALVQGGAWGFSITHNRHNSSKRRCHACGTISITAAAASKIDIDYQASDAFGRGEEHLTAALNEGDVVVYQTGTWYVDGVAVGDGQPAAWQYCLVDTIQIVWSHNCEHGVVRGFSLTAADDDNNNNNDGKTTILRVADFDSMIDFGPEQLVARLPVQQQSDDTYCCLVQLSDDLWRAAQESSA